MKKKWPVLSYLEGRSTYETLQLFTQVLGKIKLASMSWANHSWNVTLHITPTGLTTLTMPYEDFDFQIDLDLFSHELIVSTSRGTTGRFKMLGMDVADFYQKSFEMLRGLGINLEIFSTPSEIQDPIPFERDNLHGSYDQGHAAALHQALLAIQNCFMVFRSDFNGKSSPIHFFWGGFDLSLAFFSGKKAPSHPGKIPGLPNWVLQDAFSHEFMDFGFITGSEAFPQAAFYCYLYPEPKGFSEASLQTEGVFYNKEMGQFLLPYTIVAESENPELVLTDFLQGCYALGSDLAKWDGEIFKKDRDFRK